MAERSEIDRILADQYGQGIEPPPLTNFTADPQNELGTTATTADVGQVMDRMYSGVPGLFRSAADRVRGASRPDNILAGGLDTAANWVSGTPRIGEDTVAPLGLGALAMPFAVPGAVGIFGGRLARTSDQDALRRAEEMATAGRPREDIWNETGWFRGRDGQWRFEIDDSGSQFRGRPSEYGGYEMLAPVEGRPFPGTVVGGPRPLMQHDDLLRAYPDLANIDLSQQSSILRNDPNTRASWSPAGQPTPYGLTPERISLYSAASDPHSSLLHELQHAVQQREGFTPGGSPRDAPGVYNDLADEINRLIAQSGGNLDRATPEVAARVGELRRQIRSIPSDPQQLYRHLAGEVEARNVQTRAGMSPEERRASPPWQTQDVPDVDQILRQYYGPGAQMSAMRDYPIAPRSEWYGDANFETTGGRMVYMTPDEFLARGRPMVVDDVARENIDDLRRHMEDGRTLDPLALYASGREDGRHRAHAAKELGITRVPVLVWE